MRMATHSLHKARTSFETLFMVKERALILLPETSCFLHGVRAMRSFASAALQLHHRLLRPRRVRRALRGHGVFALIIRLPRIAEHSPRMALLPTLSAAVRPPADSTSRPTGMTR